MMDGCSRLEKITFGESFDWSYAPTPEYTENTSYLPTPDGQCIQDADGKWYAGSTGRPFSPSEIPSKTAETYYASKTLVPPYKVAFAMYSEDDSSLSFYKRYSEEVPFKSDGQFDGKTISALFCAHDYGGVEEYSGDRPWADYAGSIKKVIVVDDGIRPKSTSGWFRGMRNLTSIDVRKLDTSRDTDMYCMFQSCPVRTLDLSSFDTSRATEMGGMLDCPNLRWLKLGDKFSFNGQGTRRLCSPSTPSFANATGLWVSSLDDKTYVSASIPNNVAAAYAAQIEEGATRTPLDEGMFEVDTETKIYTGSPIEPSVSSRSLEEGADYSVSYGNNIEAGTATVVVAGKGNYSGELEYSFRIDPRQVGAPEAATGLVYSGAEQVGVAPSGEYEVSGGSATSAGDYTAAVSLKDKRNYVWAGEGGSDDLSIAWAIAKAAPSYSAPAVVNATFGQTLGGLELPGGFSWQDDPSTGVGDAGEHEFMATFTPSDAANYNVVRNIPVAVSVSPAAVTKGMFEVDTAAEVYTGSPIAKKVGSSLVDGTDYSVSYGNNIEAGTATVVVAGKGNYSGELEYSFRIDPRQVGAPEAATGLVYSGAEQVGVAPSGEYEVSGGSATSAGDYTAAVSLKDKRNYVWAGEGGSDDLSIAWAIAKAAPSYSAPAVVNATFGQTLGGLELPGGFSWQDDPSTGVGDAGEHEFMATFTPSDAANYNVVRNIPVIVRVSSPNLVAVPQVADLVYTGELQKAAVPESDFYAVEEICGGIDAGAYEVKLSLKEPSSCRWADDGSNSEKTVTYRILPAQLTDVMITGVPARMEATGSQLAPEPVVTFNGKTLVQGADYSLSYGENVSPGKGSVTVTAIEGSNFTGSVTVEFDIEKKAVPAPVFSDVDYSDTSWYGDAVTFVAEKGLITGYSGTTLFGVGDVLTRAQLATILWRNACPDEYASYDPETAKDTTGIDGSADGMYYTAAANWAVKNGVITGFDREDGSKDFAADDDVSFEQLVTILSRLCATPEELSAAGSDLSAFADGDLASSWSRGAFAWAADKGLVQGYDEPTGKYLRPGDPVARERVAVVLMRAFEMGVLK